MERLGPLLDDAVAQQPAANAPHWLPARLPGRNHPPVQQPAGGIVGPAGGGGWIRAAPNPALAPQLNNDADLARVIQQALPPVLQQPQQVPQQQAAPWHRAQPQIPPPQPVQQILQPALPQRPVQLPPRPDLVAPAMAAQLSDAELKKAKAQNFGTANESVTKVKYKHNIGLSDQKEGFFKGNSTVPDPLKNTMGNDFDENDPRLAARGVLSSRLDKALGTNVLTDEVFARHAGVTGSTSAMAKGKQLMTTDWADMPGTNWSEIADMGKVMGYRPSPKGKDQSQKSFSNVNYADFKNPETQKSAANLQLMDYLTGQVDRHGGNVFIDPRTGKATGIDNDAAFGTQWHAKDADGTEKTFGKEVSSLPDQVDKATADRLLGMKKADMMSLLGGKDTDPEKLSDAEKAAAMDRFKNLKGHVKQLKADDRLVENWDDGTYDEAIQNGDHRSYTARWAATADMARNSPRTGWSAFKLGKGVQ